MSKSKKKPDTKVPETSEIIEIVDTEETPMIIEDMGAQPFQWNASYVVNMIDDGQMDLDILVQRGEVWSPKKDSLLIASLLTMTPIQNCYMNKIGNVYGVIDGKQRLTAIRKYRKDGYKLHASTPPIKVNGEVFEIAGYQFSDLPEPLQKRIDNYPIRGDWFDNLSHEKEVRFFVLTNSGKAVTAAEISRSRIKSKATFKDMANHPAMQIAINDSNRRKHKHIDILSQLWCLCYCNVSSLLQKEIGPILAEKEVAEEQKDELIKSFDYLTEYYKYIHEHDKKRLPKLQKPTHVLSQGYLAFMASQKNMDADTFVERLKTLFNGEGRAVTNNERYNSAVGASSTKGENLRIRLEELEKVVNNPRL